MKNFKTYKIPRLLKPSENYRSLFTNNIFHSKLEMHAGTQESSTDIHHLNSTRYEHTYRHVTWDSRGGTFFISQGVF